MLRMMGMVSGLVLLASAASANDVDKGQKMCPVQVTAQVPCDQIGKATPAKVVEKVVEKTDEVCVKKCLSDRAWALCKTGSWFANMKGYPDEKPLNNKATKYSTARFFAQCGEDCRKPGTMRFGYKSAEGEWTVFRFGHKTD